MPPLNPMIDAAIELEPWVEAIDEERLSVGLHTTGYIF